MKLNIGCGRRILDGWVNIDRTPVTPEVFQGDLCHGLFDIPDEAASEVLLDNVIEHLEDIPKAMKEIERVTQSGAKIIIKTPHFSSLDSWRDPTHRWHLALDSLNYFCQFRKSERYSTPLRFEMVDVRLSFGGGLLGLLGRAVYSINKGFWERRLSFVLRASSMTYLLSRI